MFSSKKMQVQKTPILGQEGGCNITDLFINLCFAKCVKLSFWGGIFWPIFVVFQKNTKKRYFSTFFKAKNYKKKLKGLLAGPSIGLFSGPSWVHFKKRKPGPDNNPIFFLRTTFFAETMC